MRRVSSLAVVLGLVAAGRLWAESTPPSDKPPNVRFEVLAVSPATGESGWPEGGSLIARAVEAAQSESRTWPLSSLLEVALPPSSIWEVRVEAPDRWSPPVVMTVPPTGQMRVQRLFLWPVTRVTGRFSVPEGYRLPQELAIELRASVPEPGRPLTGTARCPVAASDGAWSCSLPVATLELVLRPGDFIPIYRGRQSLSSDSLDLGRIALRRGASVTGVVQVEDALVDPDRCEVRLSRWRPTGTGASADAAGAGGSLFGRARVNEAGFFQLVGVSPGTYVLEVEQPPLPAARVFPVEVWPELESRLGDPVVLRPGVPMRFRFSPARDWLGRRWKVALRRASATGGGYEDEAVYTGTVETSGELRLAAQPPGRYWLEVDDSLGNGFHSDPDIVLGEDGLDRQIDLEILFVEGRVLYRDEGLSAQLWFGGLHGGVGVELGSDTEGEFSGVLPRAGRWTVDLRAPEPALSLRLSAEVRPGEEGVATVEIVVPDTEVYGFVVDGATGDRVEGAVVELLGAEGRPIDRERR